LHFERFSDRKDSERSIFLAFSVGTIFALSVCHARFVIDCRYGRFLCSGDRLRPGVRTPVSTWEMILGIATALGLTAYLVYALLFPENF
jgi:K+-transporting ATPase KdpF subunit